MGDLGIAALPPVSAFGHTPKNCPWPTNTDLARYIVPLLGDPPPSRIEQSGDVAQLVERCVRNAEVEGSSPFVSTIPTASSPTVLGTRVLGTARRLSDAASSGDRSSLGQPPSPRQTSRLRAPGRRQSAPAASFAILQLARTRPTSLGCQ